MSGNGTRMNADERGFSGKIGAKGRYFGLSAWSFFDGGLVVFSTLLVYFGAKSYRRSSLVEKALVNVIARDPIAARVITETNPTLP